MLYLEPSDRWYEWCVSIVEKNRSRSRGQMKCDNDWTHTAAFVVRVRHLDAAMFELVGEWDEALCKSCARDLMERQEERGKPLECVLTDNIVPGKPDPVLRRRTVADDGAMILAVTPEATDEFFTRWDATIGPLRDDVDALHACIGKSDQRSRRVYVRAVFALIEASIDMFVQSTLVTAKDHLEPEELMLLEDREAWIDDKGSIRTRPAKTRMLHRIRFAFDMVEKYGGLDPKPNYQDVGWRPLRDSVEVRDRLTHPKLAKSIEVSDGELKDLDLALNWFSEIDFAHD